MGNMGRCLVFTLCGGMVIIASGCVSLNTHRKLQQAHRLLEAENEQSQQQLYDERQVNDSLRTKVDSMERERGSKDQLVANLQQENDRLNEIRKSATTALEGLASKTQLSDINISSPVLPAPLDSALKQFAEAHPSEVVYDPASGSVKWHSDLVFDLGSDEVKSSSLEAIKGFSDILKSAAARDFEIVVVGHTDNVRIARPETRAKHPTNWHLSAHRAIAVSNVIQQNGYPPARVSVMGCGEYRPVAENASEAGKRQNRRVEIYLVPSGTIVQGSRRADASPASSGSSTKSTHTESVSPAEPQ